MWAAPTIGPGISPVLEGILGRWGGLWLPMRERTLTAVTQGKHLLFLCFDLFCRFFWIFFFPFSPSLSLLLILLALWNLIKLLRFFFFSVTFFYCCYKPMPLRWAFAVLWSFSVSFSLFLILIFKNYCYLFLHLFLCFIFLLFFSPYS